MKMAILELGTGKSVSKHGFQMCKRNAVPEPIKMENT